VAQRLWDVSLARLQSISKLDFRVDSLQVARYLPRMAAHLTNEFHGFRDTEAGGMLSA
jgi:hypothetical protein